VAKAGNEDIPESTPFAIEDIWLNAIARFPDTKPLADLLRSSTPMTPAVRDLLAEYLNPGDPDICGGRLRYEPTDAIRRLVGSEKDGDKDGDVGVLALAKGYYAEVRWRERLGGENPAKAAAEAVGKRTGYGGWRTVYRRLEELRAVGRRLRGR
jgi:hypothetical protein